MIYLEAYVFYGIVFVIRHNEDDERISNMD